MDIVSFPWRAIKPEDAATTTLEVSILRLVFNYQRELQRLVLKYLDRNVFLMLPDLSEGMKIVYTREIFNAIEANLKSLVATDIQPAMEFTKIWYGGSRDEKLLDYTDVNRWFKTIQLLNNYIISLQRRYLESGAFACGVGADFQLLGIG
jgi:hypothetical protein